MLIYFFNCLSLVVNRAWKTLENPETRAKCMDVIEEAKAKIEMNVRTLMI